MKHYLALFSLPVFLAGCGQLQNGGTPDLQASIMHACQQLPTYAAIIQAIEANYPPSAKTQAIVLTVAQVAAIYCASQGVAITGPIPNGSTQVVIPPAKG